MAPLLVEARRVGLATRERQPGNGGRRGRNRLRPARCPGYQVFIRLPDLQLFVECSPGRCGQPDFVFGKLDVIHLTTVRLDDLQISSAVEHEFGLRAPNEKRAILIGG